MNSIQYIHSGLPVGSLSWACLDIRSAKQTKWEMFPDTLALHQHLLAHGDHHHLPLLASIQPFSAPIKPLASLTGLSRRQLTALMFSLPVWKAQKAEKCFSSATTHSILELLNWASPPDPSILPGNSQRNSLKHTKSSYKNSHRSAWRWSVWQETPVVCSQCFSSHWNFSWPR